ncbi:MAG: flippase [Thermoplasmatales archaeon]
MQKSKLEKDDPARGVLFQYVSTAITFLSGILFYIFLAKTFPTTVVGEVSLLLAIATIMNIIFTLGLQNGAQHFISFYLGKNDIGRVYSIVIQIVIFGFLLASLGSLVLFLLSQQFAMLFFHGSQYGFLVRFLALELFFMICFNLFNGVLLGLQNFRLSALVSIFGQSFSYFFSFALIYSFKEVQFAILGLAIGYGISTIISIVVIYKKISFRNSPLSLAESRPLFSYSIPILFSSIIGYGSTYIDRFVVAYFLNISDLGIYSFVLLISGSLALIISPFSNILLPKLSEIFSTGTREDLRNAVAISASVVAYVFTPAALGIASLSREILILFAGTSYLPGALPLSLLMFISAIFVTQNVLGATLFSVRATKIFLFVASATLISNVSLSFLLIPRYGLIGAAISNSSVSVVAFAIEYYFARKLSVSSFQITRIAKIWFSSVVMFLLVMFLQIKIGFEVGMLPFYIVIGLIVFVLVGKILRVFDKETKNFLFDRLFKKDRKIIRTLLLYLL